MTIILDLMLPGVDGFGITKIIRQINKSRIDRYGYRKAEADKVAGLEIGADHYVTKPFSPRGALIVKATLRRRPPKEEEEKPIKGVTLKFTFRT
jgi:DNA-binding response OmpR family regulator